LERSGAERIFQRIGQEQASRIYAVDVVCSTDPAHFLDWKSKDWVAPYVPEGRHQVFSAGTRGSKRDARDPVRLARSIGYNTNLVAREDAPKSYADLLDPSGRGKLVKATRAIAARS